MLKVWVSYIIINFTGRMKQNLKFNEKCLSEGGIREKLLQLAVV